MIQYQPYTYLIGWFKPEYGLNYWYYGCEYGKSTKIANPKNLWSVYFTSSEYVKEMRVWHGEPNYITVDEIFGNRDDAIKYEESYLRTIGAIQNPKWLNKQFGGKTFCHNEIALIKIKEARVKQVFTEEHCKKISDSLKGKKKRSTKNYFGNKNSKGKKWSAERRQNMIEKLTGIPKKSTINYLGNQNGVANLVKWAGWNKGIPASEETKKKISEKLKGRPSKRKGRKFPK